MMGKATDQPEKDFLGFACPVDGQQAFARADECLAPPRRPFRDLQQFARGTGQVPTRAAHAGQQEARVAIMGVPPQIRVERRLRLRQLLAPDPF